MTFEIDGLKYLDIVSIVKVKLQKKMLFIYLNAFLLTFSLATEAVIINQPVNKAVEVGRQTYLNCSSSSSSYPSWQFGIPGSAATIVSGSCSVVAGYTTKYRSESPTGTGSCNLVILSPTFDEAGIYTCTDSSDSTQAYATLTVWDASGSPTVSNSSEVVEGDVLTFTCTILYNTSTDTSVSSPIPPILFWTDPNGINITDALITNIPNSVSSSFDFTATKEDILTYKCTMYFNPPTGSLPPTSASNAPADVYICETNSMYDIQYPPSQPNITETPADFSDCEALNLICASDSNPSPSSFQWVDLTYGIVSNGQDTIIAEYGSIFTCTAINTIRGIEYSNFANYSASSATNNSCRFPYTENINNEDCGDAELCVYDCPDELTCYVNTYPSAFYQWFDSNGTHIGDQMIRVSENGIYECQATVYIDGLNFNASRSIEVNNCGITTSFDYEETTLPWLTTSSTPPSSTPGPCPSAGCQLFACDNDGYDNYNCRCMDTCQERYER